MHIKGLTYCLAHSNLHYIIIVVTTILVIVNVLILLCFASHLLACLWM